MDSLIKYVVGEMRVIADAPGIFVAAILVMGFAIWWAMDWRYGGIVANRDAQISTIQSQRDEYRDKLQGATPDEAKAKIEQLETRLARIEPRRLSKEQRAELISSLRTATGGPYSIAIISEASGDSPQFAADISSAFRTAGGWQISEPSVMGLGNRPPHGIAVQFRDLNNPPPEGQIVLSALRAAGFKFDIQHGGDPQGHIALLICTRFC